MKQRLEAELELRDFDRRALADAPIPETVATSIVAREEKQLASRLAVRAANRRYFETSIAETDQRLRVLANQEKRRREVLPQIRMN